MVLINTIHSVAFQKSKKYYHIHGCYLAPNFNKCYHFIVFVSVNKPHCKKTSVFSSLRDWIRHCPWSFLDPSHCFSALPLPTPALPRQFDVIAFPSVCQALSSRHFGVSATGQALCRMDTVKTKPLFGHDASQNLNRMGMWAYFSARGCSKHRCGSADFSVCCPAC